MLSVVPLDVIDVVDVRGVLGCCWRGWFVFLVSVGTIGDANGLGLAPVDYEELCGPMYRMCRHPSEQPLRRSHRCLGLARERGVCLLAHCGDGTAARA